MHPRIIPVPLAEIRLDQAICHAGGNLADPRVKDALAVSLRASIFTPNALMMRLMTDAADEAD
jgi:hypothetical protein